MTAPLKSSLTMMFITQTIDSHELVLLNESVKKIHETVNK